MSLIRNGAIAAMLAGVFVVGAPVGTAFAQDSKVEKAAEEVGDKAEDVKDKTVEAAKEVGDKAEDAKDQTVKASKKAAKVTKKAAVEVADKSEDVKDETVKASKKTGNWFTRMWAKVF